MAVPMKYAIAKDGALEVPLLFLASPHVEHIDAVGGLRAKGLPIVAAGQCSIDFERKTVRAWGRSNTLDLASREEKDAAVIRRAMEWSV